MGTCLTSFAVIWSTCKLIHPAHPAPAIIWSLEMSAGNAWGVPASISTKTDQVYNTNKPKNKKKRGMACRRGHVTCAAFLCGHQPPLMMYVCMYVCMYLCMFACMHACMYVCMYVCMYDAIYIYNVCICMYVYVCMYMYVCNYILVRVRENASWTGPLEESNID